MPLHGDGLLHGTASGSERRVMGTKLRFVTSRVVVACQHDESTISLWGPGLSGVKPVIGCLAFSNW